ncbi:TPA: phage GP46 family protein [Serratia marcescens]|uniref:phage GP46 family protein n=1 Tax=Serratia marcescens TaxID=615 RepID=UPI001BCF7B0A|nr:phage GP46 family protein [Serratia marcescens]
MTIRINWHLPAGGDIEVTHNGLSSDEGLVTLVLICLFTDARAEESDILPDGTDDRRGWPGDSFSDFQWGSKLWLLAREKLTESVRLRVENYASLAMQPLLQTGYARSAQVTATVVSSERIDFSVVLARPGKSALTVEIKKRWEALDHAV